MKTNNTLYVVIAIVVLVLIGAVVFGMDRADENPVDGTATTTNDGTGTVPAGTNNGTGGTNTGTGVNAGGSNSPVAGAIPSDATLIQLMNTSKIRIPSTGIDVALSGGQATYTNGQASGRVALNGILGKVTTNDGYDVFTTLTVTNTINNVTTNNTYVALYWVKNGVATYTSSMLIGNGVTIKDLEAKPDRAVSNTSAPIVMDSVKGYDVVTYYLDRKTGQDAGATPTVEKNTTFSVKTHNISR